MKRVNSDEIEFCDDYSYRVNGTLFTGIGVEYSEAGKVWSEIEFRRGVMHGTAREYFSSGAVRKEAQYENNTLHGVAREWNETGRLVREEEYFNGICVRRREPNAKGVLETYYELAEGDPQFELLEAIRNVKFRPLDDAS